MAARALELLALPEDTQGLILDIGSFHIVQRLIINQGVELVLAVKF